MPPAAPATTDFGNYSNWAKENMSKGVSADTLRQTLQQQGINPTQTPQNSQSQANWVEKLLPTIGGIGGGILGSFVTPILGSAAGAGIGSALGQELENKLTGSKTGTLSTGIENAAGGLIGGVAGQGISALIGKAGSMAGEGAVSSLMKQAGGLIDRDTANTLVSHGLSDFGTATKIAKQVTGAAGKDGAAFHNGLINALDNSTGKVSLANEAQNWPSLLENHVINLSDKHVSNISNDITNGFNMMAKNSGMDIERVMMPGKALGETSALEPGALQNLSPRAVFDQGKLFTDKGFKIANGAPKDVFGNITDPVKAAQADVYKNMGQMLKEKALGTDIGGTPMPLTGGDKQLLKEGIDQVKNLSPEAHKVLSDFIDKSSNWADINSAESLWARVSQAGRGVTEQANKTIGTTPTDVLAKGTLGMTQGTRGLAKAGIGSMMGGPGFNRAEAGLLSKIATGAQSKTVQDVLPRLMLASSIGAANLPNIAEASQGSRGAAGTATSPNNMMIGGGMQNPQADQLNNIISTYMGMGMADPYLLGQTTPIIQAALPQLQKASQAQALLGGLGAQFNNAGGAQGFGGGGILNSILASIPGTSQHAAASQGRNLTSLLGVNQGVAPGFLQTPEVAGTQLSTLQSLVNAMGGSGVGSALPVQ